MWVNNDTFKAVGQQLSSPCLRKDASDCLQQSQRDRFSLLRWGRNPEFPCWCTQWTFMVLWLYLRLKWDFDCCDRGVSLCPINTQLLTIRVKSKSQPKDQLTGQWCFRTEEAPKNFKWSKVLFDVKELNTKNICLGLNQKVLKCNT